jgi:hypothetical protein
VASWQQRGDGEQDQADRAERVGVALQHSRLLDERERGDEGDDAHHGVEQLGEGGMRGQGRDDGAWVVASAGFLQPVDHHDAKPVEQRGERQQQRVGVRGQPSHREMRGKHKHGEADDIGHQARRQVAVQPETDARVGERHDPDGEPEHRKLGAAAAARQRHWPQSALRRHRVRQRLRDDAHVRTSGTTLILRPPETLGSTWASLAQAEVSPAWPGDAAPWCAWRRGATLPWCSGG